MQKKDMGRYRYRYCSCFFCVFAIFFLPPLLKNLSQPYTYIHYRVHNDDDNDITHPTHPSHISQEK